MMVNLLQTNFGVISRLSGDRSVSIEKMISRYEDEYKVDSFVTKKIMTNEDDIIMLHPYKCRRELCIRIIERMKASKILSVEFKSVPRGIANNKWDALSLRETKAVIMDAPFSINKLGDINYAERYNSFFKDGEVAQPFFKEKVKPELVADCGLEYGGNSDLVQAYMLLNSGELRTVPFSCLGSYFQKACVNQLSDFFAHYKSVMARPVFHREGAPIEGVAAKVRGLDIYLITPSSNKEKLNFGEYPVSQLAEVKRKCWLSFVNNETDHDAIETSLQDWKKVDPLFEKLNVFTEKLNYVLNKVLERIKVDDYSVDNQNYDDAEGVENIQSPFSRDSDERMAESLKKVQQFLDIIRPDLEQLVLIDKRREYLQVNSFVSNFARVGANNENNRLAVKHLTSINKKCVCMSISSPADLATVFCSVFQEGKEIPVLGDARIELLVKSTDIVSLITDLCLKSESRLDIMQSATDKETELQPENRL